MRMLNYFAVAAGLSAISLMATAGFGIFRGGDSLHLGMGLFGALATVAAHTLAILFMIITGRVLREAMRTRPMGDKFLAELNVYFTEKAGYPAAFLGTVAVAATAVLGYGQRGFGISPAIHMVFGLVATIVNFWALTVEWRTLQDNQDLLDRAARELDRIDDELEARGESQPEAPQYLRFNPSLRWLFAAGCCWAPYLYWGFIVWRGDFTRLSLTFLLGTIGSSSILVFAAWASRGTNLERPNFDEEHTGEATDEPSDLTAKQTSE